MAINKIMSIYQKPAIGSQWKHNSGAIYEVYDYTNVGSERADYPERVSYINIETGDKYSRDLTDWHRSMVPHMQAV